MIRWLEIGCVGAMVMAAAGTFWVKNDTRGITAEVAALERRAATEMSAIELHEADWSLLSQPDRLQELVGAHADALGLRPAEATQFVKLDELGATLDALAPASIEDALAGIIDGEAVGTDDVVTGSVR